MASDTLLHFNVIGLSYYSSMQFSDKLALSDSPVTPTSSATIIPKQIFEPSPCFISTILPKPLNVYPASMDENNNQCVINPRKGRERGWRTSNIAKTVDC